MNADVSRLERAAYLAWPPSGTEPYDGWTLRFSDGFSRRVNSVDARGPSSLDFEAKIDACRRRYGDHRLPLLFRITPTTEPGISAALDELGFGREAETQVLVGPIPHRDWTGRGSVADAPTERWIGDQLEFAGVRADLVAPWVRMLERVPCPGGFASVHDADGATTAVGFGVVVDELLGVFEVVVDPDRRRCRQATELMNALGSWGAAHGAADAYLQVTSANVGALALYRTLGFTELYRYHYRRDHETMVRAEAESSRPG